MTDMQTSNGESLSCSSFIDQENTVEAMRSPQDGSFIRTIDVYQSIMHDKIPREEIENIARARISDNGVSPWVGRQYHCLHTVVLTHDNGHET